MNNTESELNNTQALERKVRLKNLLDKGIQLKNDINQHTSEETLSALRNIIQTSDDIITEGQIKDRAEHTTEVVMDAQVLKMNHELLSKILVQSSEFSQLMYVNAIKKAITKDGARDWDQIAQLMCTVAKPTRIKSTMLGVVDEPLSQQVVKERQRRSRMKLSAEETPESVENLKEKDEGANKVNSLYKQLTTIIQQNHNKPMPFYQLVIHPDDFMTTVDNAFQFSFMVHAGIIALEQSEDGHPLVRLTTDAERRKEIHTTQSICKLNPKFCQEMISYYNITKPLLKNFNETS